MSNVDKKLECDLKHPEHCTGKDVRVVIQRRFDKSNGNRYYFDGPTRRWCAGCRELNRGGFKYPK